MPWLQALSPQTCALSRGGCERVVRYLKRLFTASQLMTFHQAAM